MSGTQDGTSDASVPAPTSKAADAGTGEAKSGAGRSNALPSPTPPWASKAAELSRLIIAAFGLAIFLAAFVFAWWKDDGHTMSILVGAIVSLVSSISGYYFGSSAGSKQKDDVIHQALSDAQNS